MEKYKVFLGSEIAKTYDEAKNFTLARVDEYTEFNHKELFSTLAPIDNFTGNVFSLIHYNNQKNQELQNPAYPLVALLYWVYYLLQVYSFFRT